MESACLRFLPTRAVPMKYMHGVYQGVCAWPCPSCRIAACMRELPATCADNVTDAAAARHEVRTKATASAAMSRSCAVPPVPHHHHPASRPAHNARATHWWLWHTPHGTRTIPVVIAGPISINCMWPTPLMPLRRPAAPRPMVMHACSHDGSRQVKTTNSHQAAVTPQGGRR